MWCNYLCGTLSWKITYGWWIHQCTIRLVLHRVKQLYVTISTYHIVCKPKHPRLSPEIDVCGVDCMDVHTGSNAFCKTTNEHFAVVSIRLAGAKNLFVLPILTIHVFGVVWDVLQHALAFGSCVSWAGEVKINPSKKFFEVANYIIMPSIQGVVRKELFWVTSMTTRIQCMLLMLQGKCMNLVAVNASDISAQGES